MLSYSNLFQDTEVINNNDIESNLWEGADTISLLPPELELEARMIESNDQDILHAKKITDKYTLLKKELKQAKNEYNDCEEIYQNYLNTKKEFSNALFNLTNSISDLQTFLCSIDFKYMINNNKNDNDNNKQVLLNQTGNETFKHSKEYIEYLHDINKKITNGDFNLLEQINRENSRLNNKCSDIQDKLKIIRNMLSISIKESMTDEESRELKFDSKMCPICFEQDVSYCYNPCGHLICHNCSENIRNQKCPTCRQHYSSKIKVFFNI